MFLSSSEFKKLLTKFVFYSSKEKAIIIIKKSKGILSLSSGKFEEVNEFKAVKNFQKEKQRKAISSVQMR